MATESLNNLLARRGAGVRLIPAALAALVFSLSAAANAVNVEFKLSTALKGREQNIAAQLAQALGVAAPVAQGNGVFSVTASDNAKANALVSGLRERGSVLWAQAEVADAPLASSRPETEFHSRMLALNLGYGANPTTTVNALAQRTGQALKFKRMTNGNRALVVLARGTTAAALAAVAVAASTDAAIKSVERVQVLRHQWIPNDTMWTQQWALGSGVGGIRAAQAWDVTPSGTVAVAVIDTGIRAHADLDGKRMSGYDMISETFIAKDGGGRDPDATDPGDFDDDLDCTGSYDFMSSWHGTHVAGIIAASTNNGEGMAGVAPNARIVPVRALGRCGGTFDDVADSIRWAAGVPVAGVPANANPAKVLNLSLGGTGPCGTNMQSAVDAAINRGAIIVVSAGNDAALVKDFVPANCKGVIAVAASNLLGDLSSYSNFGTGISISAPGGDFGDLPGVISTLNGGITQPGVPSYATYSGTSMAAPHVAGVVALMLARDPTLSAGQVINRLLGASRGFASGTDCASASGACGSGLLDAANAVSSVVSTRAATDMTTADRLRLIELRNSTSGRYALTADPVEMAQMLAGLRGGSWERTGYSVDTFSFTAQSNRLAFAQPVCRSRLVSGGAYGYSANAEECNTFAASAAWAVDGMTFLGALPNGGECALGSTPVQELVRQDGLGYNVRTLTDAAEIGRMVNAGWTQTRIAFCAPQ